MQLRCKHEGHTPTDRKDQPPCAESGCKGHEGKLKSLIYVSKEIPRCQGGCRTCPGEGGKDKESEGHLKFQASCKHCSCCSCRTAGLTFDTLSVLTLARDLTAFWRAEKSRDLQRSLSPEDSACSKQAQPHHMLQSLQQCMQQTNNIRCDCRTHVSKHSLQLQRRPSPPAGAEFTLCLSSHLLCMHPIESR